MDPRRHIAASALAAVAWILLLGAPSQARAQDAVPLYDDLGDYHREVATSDPLAQRYFDQGLRLYYAFNHAEAIRAFREAQRLDPQCVMCWWGEALSWGPNINAPMDSASGVAAYEAVQRGLAVRDHGTPMEQALVEALATRYSRVPPADRAGLDQAYADAMASVDARFPNDPDVSTLFAESQMDLRPWDYWMESGQPYPGIDVALSRLERVVASDPKHPGACHFYIHAVEKIYPERAVPCAERLAALMPGAGHLVHMPGHIYIRVGRYLDAVEANEHAVHADETYIQDQHPAMGMYVAGYYPHNYDFMAFAGMMIGRSQLAISSAENVTRLLPDALFGSPGMDFLQHWSVRPLQMRIRFGHWEEILSTARPKESNAYALALWHYARGRAFAARGNVADARMELDELRTIEAGSTLDGLRMEFNAARDLLAVADPVLDGWIAAADGHWDQAVAAMHEAVAAEDALLYGEPPEWSIPTRQDLGAVLLAAGRPADAEQAFRDDLAHFPENGWSLRGLVLALQAQGRHAEAAEVDREFQRVWSTADIDPPSFTQ